MTQSNNYCLSIDVGNTRTHIGIIKMSDMICVQSISFYTCDISSKLTLSIESILKSQEPIQVSNTVIASVVKDASSRIKSIIGEQFGTVTNLKFTKELSLAINYQNPHSLGADRIADALYGCYYYPKGCIIIDAGTAIKTDLIVNSQFWGGSIIPGIQAQLTSLNNSTSSLPLLKTFDGPVSLPGNSTTNCMISGIIHGAAGALNNFVKIYKQEYSQDLPILTTGGSWNLLCNLVDFKHSHVPNMTLIGTSLYNSFCNAEHFTPCSSQIPQTNIT